MTSVLCKIYEYFFPPVKAKTELVVLKPPPQVPLSPGPLGKPPLPPVKNKVTYLYNDYYHYKYIN